MDAMGCYCHGTMAKQIEEMRAFAMKQNMLILIDEVSKLEGHNVTILKDVMTAMLDVCGIVMAGTPYFFKNLLRGASRERHLFSETKDRLFFITYQLDRPTEQEAEEIFTANGITDKNTLQILLGKSKRKELITRSWLAKPTFRGIRDCIDMVRSTEMCSEINYNTLNM